MEKATRLILYTDGSSLGNPGPASIGVVIVDEVGRVLAKISQGIGRATSNQAEYSALIAGLEEAARMGAEHIEIRSDSELIVKQLKGEYRVKHPVLRPLYERARDLVAGFRSHNIAHIPRTQNKAADALSRRALR
ncbi:MAG: ribonuclease HI family protein [Chloroflexota bacterium]|nr:ribonuclease HI family protein [Chloroflexota bacterium]